MFGQGRNCALFGGTNSGACSKIGELYVFMVIEQLLSAKSKSEDLKSRVEAKRELNEVVALGREIHKCLLKLSLDGLETW
mgnify:CR=1 FL=1